MRGAVIILNVFAALWCAAALIALRQAAWTLAVPALVSLLLIVWGVRATSGAPARGRHVLWLVFACTLAEGALAFAAVYVLHEIKHMEALPSVIAAIVGLHFLPMAIGIPAPVYWLTGFALMAIGVAGYLLLPPDLRLPATGFAAAAVLWLSALSVAGRARRMALAT